jgi:hypothetical protein
MPVPTPGPSQTPGSGPTIDEVQTRIFNVTCLTTGCHNAADRAGNLILEAGLSWSNLVDVVPEITPAAEAGYLRVRPFDPDTSFLVAKLVGPTPGQGSRMPQGGPFLSDSDVEIVREWIRGGALDSQGPTATQPPTSSVTPTRTPTATASITLSPTNTGTPTLTPTGTVPPSETPTITATASPTATIRIVTLAELQETIFTPSCAIATCHFEEGATFSGNLDLEAPVAYANLVGVTPDNPAAALDGLIRVDPFNPDNSFLVVKVCHDDLSEELCPVPRKLEYGAPMPFPPRTPLPAEQVEAIRLWILRGAPETD